jgi:hypothetical protein
MHMIGYFEGIDSESGIAWRSRAPRAAEVSACATARMIGTFVAIRQPQEIAQRERFRAPD